MQLLKKYMREPINGLTHFAGAIFSIVGLVLLLLDASAGGSVSHIVAFTMFGLSMTLLYTASALYHSLKVKEKTVALLRRIDHIMIYVLIAGSYTPICLIVLEGDFRWFVFISVWSVALVGILKKFFWVSAPHWITVFLYLAMGWMGVFLFPTLFEKLPLPFLLWLVTGGLAYTLGTVILGLKKPDPLPGWFGYHEIWHLFVMAGTFSHFWAFYQYLTAYGL